MNTPGRILFVRHAPREYAYNLESDLEARGYPIETHYFGAEARPREPQAYQAALVFGGYMGAKDEHKHPWILEELAYMESLMKQGTPLLGLCLGGQMLARIMGAPVFRTPVPEFGYLDITLTEEGQRSPVFQGVSNPFQGLLWHQDAFELPPGCRHLASSAHCACQAFAAGPNAYGLQFHLEFSAEHLRHMIEHDRNDLPAQSVAWQEPHLVANNAAAHAAAKRVMMTLFENLVAAEPRRP